MSKVSITERNNKRWKMNKKFSSKRNKLKDLTKNKALTMEERFQATVKLAKLPRNSASIRYRNRCAITGRPRGFIRKYGMSRNAFRKLASEGLIPGVKKASW